MLPWPARLYFWGAHGIFAEVIFTGIWEYVVSGGPTLMGTSSMWSFPIYSAGTLLLAEPLCDAMIALKIPLFLRCCFYVLCVYSWELTLGTIMRYFGVCSWDYTDFDYDFYGLITMEYAPIWFCAGLLFEYIYHYMKELEYSPAWRKYAQPSRSRSNHIVYLMMNKVISLEETTTSTTTVESHKTEKIQHQKTD